MIARKRGRLAAKRTGPVKNAIAFPIPTRHRNCSAIAGLFPLGAEQPDDLVAGGQHDEQHWDGDQQRRPQALRDRFAQLLRVVLEAREHRQRDEPHRAHRHFQHHVDEAVGEPVEADRHRAPEDAHQQRVGAAVDEAGEVGGEDADREADQLARMRPREAKAAAARGSAATSSRAGSSRARAAGPRAPRRRRPPARAGRRPHRRAAPRGSSGARAA